MGQTFFSKLDPEEKKSRLVQFALTKAKVTIWVKGSKDKIETSVLSFDQELLELVLNSSENHFKINQKILCSFIFRGMTFFSEVTYLKSVANQETLHFTGELFKSERRASYRLLTYPIYKVWAEIDLGEISESGKVFNLKTKSNQTQLFKDFLKLVDSTESTSDEVPRLKIRIQDLSTTGMALQVGAIESKYFIKDIIFNQVHLRFQDETIEIPKVQVVHVVDYISRDVNLRSYKVGLHFNDLPVLLEDRIGKKISGLLRQIDLNKDFENLIK